MRVDMDDIVCFEGHIDFRTHQEVFAAISKDINIMIDLVSKISDSSYGRGFAAGERSIQKEMRYVLGIFS